MEADEGDSVEDYCAENYGEEYYGEYVDDCVRCYNDYGDDWYGCVYADNYDNECKEDYGEQYYWDNTGSCKLGEGGDDNDATYEECYDNVPYDHHHVLTDYVNAKINDPYGALGECVGDGMAAWAFKNIECEFMKEFVDDQTYGFEDFDNFVEWAEYSIAPEVYNAGENAYMDCIDEIEGGDAVATYYLTVGADRDYDNTSHEYVFDLEVVLEDYYYEDYYYEDYYYEDYDMKKDEEDSFCGYDAYEVNGMCCTWDDVQFEEYCWDSDTTTTGGDGLSINNMMSSDTTGDDGYSSFNMSPTST